jgi:hypothetical protein
MNHRILFFFFPLDKLGYRSLSLISGSFTYTYMGEHSEEHSNLSCILGRNCIVPSVFQPLIEDWPDITLWSKRLSVTRLVA